MELSIPYRVNLSFPGHLDYIFPVRKFIAEILLVSNYSQKFAYRSEVIVDEVCSNAVAYGCRSANARIDLSCLIYPDRMEIQVKDQGGNPKDLERLRMAVESEKKPILEDFDLMRSASKNNLGLEIVRLLSEEIDLHIDRNNVTTIRVIRKRNLADEDHN